MKTLTDTLSKTEQDFKDYITSHDCYNLRYKDFIVKYLNCKSYYMNKKAYDLEYVMDALDLIIDYKNPKIIEFYKKNMDFFKGPSRSDFDTESEYNRKFDKWVKLNRFLLRYLEIYYEVDINEMLKKGFLTEEGLDKLGRNIYEELLQENGYNYVYKIMPSVHYMTYIEDVINEWLIYFTDYESAKQILKNGFHSGIYDEKFLSYTEIYNDFSENNRHDKDYSSAFTLDDVLDNFTDYVKKYGYGETCLIFKSNGVKVFHDDDGELYVIFDSKAIDPKNILLGYINENNQIEFKEGDKVIETVDTTNNDIFDFLDDNFSELI